MANEKLTELVFILDRSGSMASLVEDTVGGFNAMIEKQKKEEGECLVSTVLFDDRSEVLHDRLPLAEIEPLTEKEYYARGCTALIDALGGAVRHIEQVHRYIRKEDVPARTMFVITTDGMENASRKYSAEEVRRMISKHEEKDGWEFLFIGANIDAVSTAATYGIRPERAVKYKADPRGTELLYQTVSETVSKVRFSRAVSDDWAEKIAEDTKKRGE